MLPIRLAEIRSILCLGAHPGDLEIGCGGTLMKLLAGQQGIEVHWAVLGAAGPCREEVEKAAERVLRDAGARRLAPGEFREGRFRCAEAAVHEFFGQLGAEVSPDLVLSPRADDAHPDRRLVWELAQAAFRARLVLEYEVPGCEGAPGRPNLYVPLDEPTARRKVHAIVECFRSRQGEQRFAADTFWSLLCLRGLECHSPTRMAEGLVCRKMVLG